MTRARVRQNPTQGSVTTTSQANSRHNRSASTSLPRAWQSRLRARSRDPCLRDPTHSRPSCSRRETAAAAAPAHPPPTPPDRMAAARPRQPHCSRPGSCWRAPCRRVPRRRNGGTRMRSLGERGSGEKGTTPSSPSDAMDARARRERPNCYCVTAVSHGSGHNPVPGGPSLALQPASLATELLDDPTKGGDRLRFTLSATPVERPTGCTVAAVEP